MLIKIIKVPFFILATQLLLALPAFASELVYQPINPSFGGNPINGSYLLNKAQAQNKHKAPARARRSYTERFQESLERSYINKMVRLLTDQAFGTGDIALAEDALFVSGDYEVLVTGSNSDSISVQISNTETGEVTLIEVPRYDLGAGEVSLP
ncbi:curli production assembly protein CsgF [Thalassomonas viridans]|uniref:Curli production assembly/transport component CsgF n=2 Tax=Thalassomonas viridans TaxID=137584 RepID=A0AAE9Z9N9_9GAMM|nr:curli production assembly protein CsgF [Thalassomonas viridans]